VSTSSNASYYEYIFFAEWRIVRSNPSSGSVYYFFADLAIFAFEIGVLLALIIAVRQEQEG
jgi:hypothetical protein